MQHTVENYIVIGCMELEDNSYMHFYAAAAYLKAFANQNAWSAKICKNITFLLLSLLLQFLATNWFAKAPKSNIFDGWGQVFDHEI